jgi:hypothetical protein
MQARTEAAERIDQAGVLGDRDEFAGEITRSSASAPAPETGDAPGRHRPAAGTAAARRSGSRRAVEPTWRLWARASMSASKKPKVPRSFWRARRAVGVFQKRVRLVAIAGRHRDAALAPITTEWPSSR